MRTKGWQKRVKILRLVMSLVKYSLLVTIGSLFSKDKRAYASKMIHYWARNMLDILNTKFQVFNHQAVEFDTSRPYIIMSNHASHFDIPLLCVAFPREVIGMIAKKELFQIPFFGRSMKLGGCIAIDRENKYQALQDLEEAKKVMTEGVRIWIAPEGTRSRTGKMGKFKKGGFKIAYEVKAIIVPVTIVGSGKILPPETFDVGIGEKVEIHIGKPIDVTGYERQELQKLMTDVSNTIQYYMPGGTVSKQHI